ncbi:DUF1413 domain-containing protein [Mesobaculum littorinae]|uniref:DUF1413 domain-containing protein n=1 Tax=Mesobaculum littorinae TaxID=2486419 RepID=A0A438AKD5_9RHOB|nr:DUF1413 domain-containing protein [Mesobaculum littorinae]RVV99152.1 DUF1413 domain-containing protein [Mesobaculum littorinae]
MQDCERDRLAGRLADFDTGEFHFPDLYGPGWDSLPIGEKVSRGRDFLKAVRNGDFPGVDDTGRKAGGGRLYRWDGR